MQLTETELCELVKVYEGGGAIDNKWSLRSCLQRAKINLQTEEFEKVLTDIPLEQWAEGDTMGLKVFQTVANQCKEVFCTRSDETVSFKENEAMEILNSYGVSSSSELNMKLDLDTEQAENDHFLNCLDKDPVEGLGALPEPKNPIIRKPDPASPSHRWKGALSKMSPRGIQQRKISEKLQPIPHQIERVQQALNDIPSGFKETVLKKPGKKQPRLKTAPPSNEALKCKLVPMLAEQNCFRWSRHDHAVKLLADRKTAMRITSTTIQDSGVCFTKPFTTPTEFSCLILGDPSDIHIGISEATNLENGIIYSSWKVGGCGGGFIQEGGTRLRDAPALKNGDTLRLLADPCARRLFILLNENIVLGSGNVSLLSWRVAARLGDKDVGVTISSNHRPSFSQLMKPRQGVVQNSKRAVLQRKVISSTDLSHVQNLTFATRIDKFLDCLPFSVPLEPSMSRANQSLCRPSTTPSHLTRMLAAVDANRKRQKKKKLRQASDCKMFQQHAVSIVHPTRVERNAYLQF